jgi:hypothetical protein
LRVVFLKVDKWHQRLAGIIKVGVVVSRCIQMAAKGLPAESHTKVEIFHQGK